MSYITRDLFHQALLNIPIGLCGRHPSKKFSQRLGLNKKSIIPHMRKVVRDGDVIFKEINACDYGHTIFLYFRYQNNIYPCIIANNIDGVRTLYPKTVLTSDHILEQPKYAKGRYAGKTIKKPKMV